MGLLWELVSTDTISACNTRWRRFLPSVTCLSVLIMLFFDMCLNLLTVPFMLPFFIFMLRKSSLHPRPPKIRICFKGKIVTDQETWVRSLGREDPLEKEMTTLSSLLAWEIPWTEEPVGYSSWGHKEPDLTW